ncbi:voltage-gated potassium channel KCNC1-like [Hyperolius riggenbachi]|uniref:voltage-gated potassium channel KCNC1-like n=1 Tax=Hyperolius riggenbachi TaxID=752182 RepID=UPI0035A33A06
MDSSSRRLVINVGGIRFETYASTLLSFPGTKLSALAELPPNEVGNFDHQRNEFFFDRNPKVFGYILDYYRTKHLHCSDNMCKALIVEELNFWELNTSHLSHCCWLKINNKSQVMEEFSSWEEATQIEEQQFPINTGRIDYSWRGRWQPRIWNLLQNPYSSLASMCVAAISLLFTIAAIIIFFEETKRHFAYVVNKTVLIEVDSYHTFHQEMDYEGVPYLIYLELLCVIWFLIEFGARLFFCPNRKKFLKHPLNWVDFLSLFPVFIELIAEGQMHRMDILWQILGFMRTVYILKLFRLILLIEGSLVLRVLSGTLRAITREIIILLLVLALETILFATLAYYAEWVGAEHYAVTPLFGDIYSCCWFAIITLTTVGYGDLYPQSTFGKVITSLTAICGILTIVLPIPILMIKFQHYYSIALAKEKLKLQRSGQKP